MRICRKRYVITRNNDTEIFCGLARNYQFKPIENIGNTAIKTYLSRNKAIASFESSWAEYIEPKYNCLEVSETVEGIAELAIQALQEKAERENPKPLTVKQLEKMDGQAVFCVDAKGDGKWALVHSEDEVCTDGDFGDWEFYEYAHKNEYGWHAYRYKPKHIGEANDMQEGEF